MGDKLKAICSADNLLNVQLEWQISKYNLIAIYHLQPKENKWHFIQTSLVYLNNILCGLVEHSIRENIVQSESTGLMLRKSINLMQKFCGLMKVCSNDETQSPGQKKDN